jgi:hypothetical protein
MHSMRRAAVRALVVTSLSCTVACSDLLGLDDYRAGASSTGSSGSGGADQAWLEGFEARREISISAAMIGEELSDFPLAVQIPPGGDLQLRVATDDGADIVFTDVSTSSVRSNWRLRPGR